MRIVVVTVNYCCAGSIVERLPGTAEQVASCGGEWWIVDNASPDNSAEVLAAATANFPNVHLVLAEKNGGFGYGNNQVINRVLTGEIEADYLYFLNPDASPMPGAISEMISYLDAHEEAAVVGSGLLRADFTHTDSMFRFPSFWSEVESSLQFGPISRLLCGYRLSLEQPEESGSVDWVAGTSFMARADVFRAIGGFDEDFFLYWEEVELCYRVKKAGLAVHALPSAKVAHVGGVSTGMHRDDESIPGYWHQARNLYFYKTRTGGPLPLLNFVTACCLLLRRFRELLTGRTRKNPHFLRDHIRYALDYELR